MKITRLSITHLSRWSISIILAIVAMAPAARAQEIAGSFDQLRVLVKPGDTITVTDAAGAQFKGKLTTLSPASLALMVDGRQRTLQAADVQTVKQRRSDSVADGAKWGFGTGAVLGVAAGLMLASEYSDDPDGAIVFWASMTYGALGAGI